MRLTASQLQTQHKALIEALKRGETVEITYHGQILGVVHPKSVVSTENKQAAAEAFFGMHKDMGIDNVEDGLRSVRKGRRNRLDAI